MTSTYGRAQKIRGAPHGLRLHIGLFGRRNGGKSSLLNALTHQDTALVSPQPGTTTDPVRKAMELAPIGPVLFIDTAGTDDTGDLGAGRVRLSRRELDHVDLAILVAKAGLWGSTETALLEEFARRELPAVVAVSQIDRERPSFSALERLTALGLPTVQVSAHSGEGLMDLRRMIVELVPDGLMKQPPLVVDRIPSGSTVVLVTPIDKEAPRGRLIAPQVQVLRELLDKGHVSVVVQDAQLTDALNRLKEPPAAIITDSQVFGTLSAVAPQEIPLSSFSILFARAKGDLTVLTQGVVALERLRQRIHRQPPPRILIAEACSHHPIEDDIAREKLPRWLTSHLGVQPDFTFAKGRDFPDLAGFELVVHCGACVWNRRSMLSRILQCQAAGVPISNYGLVIGHLHGILDRALSLFPDVRRRYREGLQSRVAPGTTGDTPAQPAAKAMGHGPVDR